MSATVHPLGASGEPSLDRRYGFAALVEEGGHCRDPGAYVAALVALAEAEGAKRVAARAIGFRIEAGRLLIRDDHVIVEMLRGLGAAVRRVSEPFDPEGGAYGEHNRQPSHPHGHGHHDH